MPPFRRLVTLASLASGLILAGALPAAAWDGYRDDGSVHAEITNTGIGTPGADQRIVAPGASVSISFDWMAYAVGNPESILALRYGFSGEAKPRTCVLIGNTHGNPKSGSVTKSLKAPSTAGSVYLHWEVVEDSCHGTTITPWASGAMPSNPEDLYLGRLMVRSPSVTAGNVTVASVRLKGLSSNVNATQNETMSVTLSAKVDGTTCPTCRYRVLVGWSDAAAPAVCVYNAKPKGTIKTITPTFNLVVPAGTSVAPGQALDRFVVFQVAKSSSTTCAKGSWPGGAPTDKANTSFLGHVAVQ